MSHQLMQTMHAHQQLYWGYSKDWNDAYDRSLPKQRQNARASWPTFLDQILQPYDPNATTSMSSNDDEDDDDMDTMSGE